MQKKLTLTLYNKTKDMNTEKRIFALLNKVEEIKKSKSQKLSKIENSVNKNAIFNAKLEKFKKSKKPVVAKKPNVKLGKVDELNYLFVNVEEESSRLSYFVDEFFDEQFEIARTAFMTLNDVFKNNSEGFYTSDDFAEDKTTLEEIYALAEELGVDVTEVYPDWQSHIEAIESFANYEEMYLEKEREFYSYFG
jgi:predicted ATPase